MVVIVAWFLIVVALQIAILLSVRRWGKKILAQSFDRAKLASVTADLKQSEEKLVKAVEQNQPNLT